MPPVVQAPKQPRHPSAQAVPSNRPTKTGRNAPCHCGSGKKYKRCCGDLSKPTPPRAPMPRIDPALEHALQQRADQMLRAHQARERVRQQQQGYGKPIISVVESHGYRIVGVGNTVFWSKDWRVFPDFLLHFLKKTMNVEWGTREQQSGSSHPLFRWLRKFNDYAAAHGATHGRIKSGPIVGYIASIFNLAYSLYLIGHNDTIPARLVRRLRDQKTFMPAFYETLVGATLAVAGFEISNAETKTTDQSTPEFRARSKRSGKTYDVEAKRKDRWTAPTDDVHADSFRNELEKYVRGRIHNASRKKLQNPIVWIELSIPKPMSEADWRSIADAARDIIRNAGTMTVDGVPISPAYVVITNHTHLANEDADGDSSAAFIEPIDMPDYPFGRPVDIEAALEGYDKHRDTIRMMDAWKIARTIPVTFDGSPPELLSPDGQPQKIVQIGDTILVPDEKGQNISVQVEEVCSMGNVATLFVYDAATQRRWLASYPLTEAEAKAAKQYSDAIFGKPSASRKLSDDDPFELYDWLLDCYAETTPEQMAKIVEGQNAPNLYVGLTPAETRIRMCREYTKAMWAQKMSRKPGAEKAA